MSYDLYFFQPQSGKAPEECFEQELFVPLSAEKLHAIAADLRVQAEHLLGGTEPEQSAQNEGEGYDSLLLSSAHGLQAYFDQNMVGLSLPYWAEGAEAQMLATKVMTLARMLMTTHGLTGYDPQAGCAFDAQVDLPPGVASFDEVADRFRGQQVLTPPAEAQDVAHRKRRWKIVALVTLAVVLGIVQHSLRQMSREHASPALRLVEEFNQTKDQMPLPLRCEKAGDVAAALAREGLADEATKMGLARDRICRRAAAESATQQ